jgi:hypothetical protein
LLWLQGPKTTIKNGVSTPANTHTTNPSVSSIMHGVAEVDFQVEAGLLWPHIHTRRSFKDHFGFSPETVTQIWKNLRYVCPAGARPEHLLWLLYWWKTYAVTGVCAAFCRCDTKTFMKWRTDMQSAVGSMGNVSVQWPFFT